MLLLLREMGTFFGGADDAWETVDMVLAVSAAIDGDRIDDTGDVTDCGAMVGDLNGCEGCIGNCTCCVGAY